MRKNYVFVALLFAMLSADVSAQKDDPNVLVAADGRATKRFFKPSNPAEDKTDMFDVSGISGTTFTTSNTSDGSPNSYKHAQRIIVALQASGKPNTLQLVFYSPNSEMPYAAAEENTKINVYFPVSMYGEIREKIEQALNARKKVQVKVYQGKDGVREASLVL